MDVSVVKMAQSKRWRRGMFAVCALLVISALDPRAGFPQEPRYLFTVETLQPVRGEWMVQSHSGFGVRTAGPFGSDGFEQRAGVQLGLSRRLSLIASGGVLISRESDYEGEALSAELIGRVLTAGGRSPVDVSIGGGFSRDYGGVEAASARLLVGRGLGKWNISTNAYFEKAFESMRDKVDVVTIFGVSRELSSWFRGGIEMIAEDLEGFWEEEEAEGGAKMLIGPTLHFSGIRKNLYVTLGGGRVVYLTESSASSQAIRLLPTIPGRDGYVVRATMTYMM